MHPLRLPDLTISLVEPCCTLVRAQTVHLQTLCWNSHAVPVMYVLKADMSDVVRDQLANFSGCLALQNAGESLIDLLPMKGDGLDCGAQDSAWLFPNHFILAQILFFGPVFQNQSFTAVLEGSGTQEQCIAATDGLRWRRSNGSNEAVSLLLADL
jgi:hypothetical protein